MPQTSGTWTNATYLGVAVYRGAVSTVSNPDGVNATAASNTSVIKYLGVTPITYPAALGTGWYAAFANHETATNYSTPPTGMVNLTVGGTRGIAVHDTNGPTSSNWPPTNSTVNNSGLWTAAVIQIASAGGAVTRVGAAAANSTTIPIPPGHRIGDLMVLHAVAIGGAVPTNGSWNGLYTSSGADVSYTSAYRVVTVSDTTFVPRIFVY